MQSAHKDLPRHLSRIGDIAGFYEGYILDLWGVVHNGIAPFEDTIPTLLEMKRSKRHVWFLSNAPRRAAVVARFLEGMGILPEMYDGIMTSGEATFQALQDEYLEKWGRKCLHIGKAEDVVLCDGLDIEFVETPAEADFLLCTGVAHFDDTADMYHDVLRDAAARRLPFLCANPDRIVHVGDQLVLCPGTLADIYIEMNGQVTWFGKPYRHVYGHCLAAMPNMRILAIGDAMPTDIEGATGAGIDSALVTGGIHRDHLSSGAAEAVRQNQFYEFFSGFPYRPTYTLDKLAW